MLTNDIYMKRARKEKWIDRETIKVSRKTTVVRVLAIEGGKGCWTFTWKDPDIEIETRFVMRRCIPKEAGLFLCGYGSWQRRHL